MIKITISPLFIDLFIILSGLHTKVFVSFVHYDAIFDTCHSISWLSFWRQLKMLGKCCLNFFFFFSWIVRLWFFDCEAQSAKLSILPTSSSPAGVQPTQFKDCARYWQRSWAALSVTNRSRSSKVPSWTSVRRRWQTRARSQSLRRRRRRCQRTYRNVNTLEDD